MASFIRGAPDQRYSAIPALADALGMGLGKGINSYFANQALENVLSDKSLSSLPLSARMGKIQSALQPYGENGQQLLQNRLMIEQHQEEEKQKERDLKRGDILRRRLSGEEISDKEKSLFSPQEELAIAKHEQAIEIQKLKNQGKAPLGGLGGQPIPPEQIKAIENVINNNPEATADQLAIELGKAGVNPSYSGPYIQNRRDTEETKAKNAVENTKLAAKEDIHFHEESAEYDKQLNKNAQSAEKQLEVIEDLEKSIEKTSPASAVNVLKFFGNVGDRISKAFLTKDQAAINSAVPEFLEGKKELFGVRLSDADLKLLQDKLPDIANSKEANREIVRLIKRYAQRAIDKKNVANKVREEKGVKVRQGTLRPLGYENLVEQAFSESTKGIKMMTPDGRSITVPLGDLEEAEKLGAKRA
jgi:hypothetical protein